MSTFGLQSSGGDTVGSLVGKDIVAKSITLTQSSGADAVAVSTNGARIHFGAGASDYASSDGTTVTFAGPVATVSTLSATSSITSTSSSLRAGNGNFVSLADTPAIIQSSCSDANASSSSAATKVWTSVVLTATDLAFQVLQQDFATSVFGVNYRGDALVTRALVLSSYTDDSATPGNRTVNSCRGKNAFAIGAAAVTITNNFVTANSQIICTLEFVDVTLTQILTAIPGPGSFVVTGNGNATAATKFSWVVIN